MAEAVPVTLIIAGSRNYPAEVCLRYLRTLDPTKIGEVVSGCCRGPDTWGEEWAIRNGVKIKHMPADWERHGRRAGPIRNVEMVDYAAMFNGGLLAFWNGRSGGTKHVIDYARKKGLLMRVVSPPPERADQKPRGVDLGLPRAGDVAVLEDAGLLHPAALVGDRE